MIGVRKSLFLSPHTDDAELGCGGTMARMRRDGTRITIVAFSAPREFPQIANEFRESAKAVDAEAVLLDYPIRSFGDHRQSILDFMVGMGGFDAVFCPSTHDSHQDHAVIREEAFRAFKQCTIFGYEEPWNCREFRTDVFFVLSAEDMSVKSSMLDAYGTQAGRVYMKKDKVMALASVRGMQVGAEFAEAVEMIRMVVR